MVAKSVLQEWVIEAVHAHGGRARPSPVGPSEHVD
jgi:hypothetical protein